MPLHTANGVRAFGARDPGRAGTAAQHTHCQAATISLRRLASVRGRVPSPVRQSSCKKWHDKSTLRRCAPHRKSDCKRLPDRRPISAQEKRVVAGRDALAEVQRPGRSWHAGHADSAVDVDLAVPLARLPPRPGLAGAAANVREDSTPNMQGTHETRIFLRDCAYRARARSSWRCRQRVWRSSPQGRVGRPRAAGEANRVGVSVCGLPLCYSLQAAVRRAEDGGSEGWAALVTAGDARRGAGLVGRTTDALRPRQSCPDSEASAPRARPPCAA